MKGYLHSIESFSTIDGPGIRSVVFLQGCPLRCLYCHNPDSWNMHDGRLIDSRDVVSKVLRNINYIKHGGVTISGGEPTSQPGFLLELLTGFKSSGLHTAVDTSGYASIDDISKIVEYTDLFVVDIKHMDENKCRELTGKSNSRLIPLLEYLDNCSKDVWIRNVILQGYTDDQAHIEKVCSVLKRYKCIKLVELLPYHDMAKHKYRHMGIAYKLDKMPSYNSNAFQYIKNMYKRYYDGIII